MMEEHDLGPVDRIPPGEGRTFDLGGERRIAVFRTRAGRVYATQASCPHREGPLADGLLDDRCIVYPLHGFKFDLESGEALGHTCGGIETYVVSVTSDGRVLLSID
jgi:nitrite reductase (NADH) small subunit